MASFMRLDVINTLPEIGLAPLFFNDDVATSVELTSACSNGGAKVIEFTNRGESAYPVFTELVKHFAETDPSVILGTGSVLDAPITALYLSAGANFIVAPSFYPEIAFLCNRRKILYILVCATEISTAEEHGVKICKIFPGDTVGIPPFIKALMAHCPWHCLMPTGGVDPTEASIKGWIKAGTAAIGMGNKLITTRVVRDKDYVGITQKKSECIEWIRKVREG